jgi:hypothetical protein
MKITICELILISNGPYLDMQVKSVNKQIIFLVKILKQAGAELCQALVKLG